MLRSIIAAAILCISPACVTAQDTTALTRALLPEVPLVRAPLPDSAPWFLFFEWANDAAGIPNLRVSRGQMFRIPGSDAPHGRATTIDTRSLPDIYSERLDPSPSGTRVLYSYIVANPQFYEANFEVFPVAPGRTKVFLNEHSLENRLTPDVCGQSTFVPEYQAWLANEGAPQSVIDAVTWKIVVHPDYENFQAYGATWVSEDRLAMSWEFEIYVVDGSDVFPYGMEAIDILIEFGTGFGFDVIECRMSEIIPTSPARFPDMLVSGTNGLEFLGQHVIGTKIPALRLGKRSLFPRPGLAFSELDTGDARVRQVSKTIKTWRPGQPWRFPR